MTSFSNQLTLPIPRVEAGNPLPVVDVDYARRVRAAGHVRIGIGPWLLNPQGEIFMQTHVGSLKTRDGAIGTVTETVLWRMPQPGHAPRIEQPAETIARALRDERGIERIAQLRPRIAPRDGWLLHACPVAYNGIKPTIMGIWPVLQLNEIDSRLLTANFKPNDEVRDGGFMTQEELRWQPRANFRFDIKDWLLRCIDEGHIGPSNDTRPLNLVSPGDHGPVQDMDLESPLLAGAVKPVSALPLPTPMTVPPSGNHEH